MKLKVCGLKYSENIEQVASLGPDYMGFIFYAKSKRFVGEGFVMPQINNTIKKVGVFVNAKADYIVSKVEKYSLAGVQLHGDETPTECAEIAAKLPPRVEVLKAFGVDENFDFEPLGEYESACDYFLFDTKTKAYGGSGHTFDWSILDNYTLKTPFLLSGGLGVEEALAARKSALNAYALDVNSKFEIEPALKNIDKLKLIVK